MIMVSVKSRKATYTSDDPITTGSIGIPVKFDLSDDYSALSNIAVFQGSGTSVDVVLTSENSCEVPPEVLVKHGGPLRIGVYGRNSEGTIAIPTVWVSTDMIRQGTKPSGVDPSQPKPDWTAQVQQIATDALSKAEDAYDKAEEAIDIASRGNDYENISNKPRINGVELIGNKIGEELHLQDKIVEVSEADIDDIIFGGI